LAHAQPLKKANNTAARAKNLLLFIVSYGYS